MRWKTERGCDRLLHTFHGQVLLESCQVNFSSTFLWKTVLLLDWEVYDGHSPEFFNPWKIFVRKGLPLRRTILLFFWVFFKCRRNDTSQCKIMRGKNYLSYLRKWKICLRQFLEFFTMRFNFKVKYCLDFRERNCMQLSSLILCPFLLNMYLI